MAKGKVLFDIHRCKGCHLCIVFCPQGILQQADYLNKKGYSPVEVKDPHSCTGCAICYQVCPDMVVEVYRERSQERRVTEA